MANKVENSISIIICISKDFIDFCVCICDVFMVLSSTSQRQFSLEEKDCQVFFDLEDSECQTSGQSLACLEMWICSHFVWQRNVTFLSWVTRKAYLNGVWFWNGLKLSRKIDLFGTLWLYRSYLVHLCVGKTRMTNRKENPVGAFASTQMWSRVDRVHALFYCCSETLISISLAGSVQFLLFCKCNMRLSKFT